MNKSNIIKDIEKLLILKKWISENGKIKNINLLYRASEDGDSSTSFFNKCCNKGATVSLIKTKKIEYLEDFQMLNGLKKCVKNMIKQHFYLV